MALVLGVTSVAAASPGTGEEVNFDPTERRGLEVEGDILKINDTLGYGWCIDLGFPKPEERPHLFKDATTGYKLTHVGAPRETPGPTEEIPFEGHQRDAAINVLKKLRKAYQAGDYEEASTYNMVLQIVLTSSLNKADGQLHVQSPKLQERVKRAQQYLREDAGYELTLDPIGVREIEGANIPKAGDDEYITVVPPKDYDITKGAANQAQRIVPIDQPGLDDEPKKPESSEVPVPEETTEATTERPAPKKPEIGTNADFADGAKRVVAGATVNDTVTYKDLVPGKEYTLEAELISKADGTTVVGSGSQKFTADESGSGEVVVPIKVNDDVTEPVEAAVAF
ncbi:VaFE repeat-containing surface-anchored protein, partial [Corynebacterium mastitidis]|uniref:VaFE repeat-containing surface-anchored protein n=1 Tax=Corynebacterium mastitidis TaxID=161890 RepID=UPI0014614A13